MQVCWHLSNDQGDKGKTAKGIAVTKNDNRLMTGTDVTTAFALLTRLPLRVDMNHPQSRSAHAAWAYPLAGAAIGAILATFASVLLWFGMSASVVAGLVLAGAAMLTGAMHEDGLADSFDGLWGGWDRARRLEIMKDSHIGTFGVLALILSFGLRWVTLAAIIGAGFHWPALIAVAAVSRAAMVPVMAALPHARKDGLSRHIGKPPVQIAWIAIALAFVASLIAMGLATLAVLLVAVLVTTIWAATAHQKIGGQTGDILGATQQLNEIALLILIAGF